jgi:uncharacterized membrane protein YecN with MAPEG domain
MILPITLTIAAAAALLNIWLAVRIGRVRMSKKVSIGHGGDALLETRMRAQANFGEYTPFVLILLALIELAKGSQTWLWLVAITYILARIAHAFGMERPAPNKLRAGGAMITMLVLLGLAGYALSIPYLAKIPAAPTMLSAEA